MTSEMLQKLDLSQCALSQDLLAEDVGDLLNGNSLLRLAIRRGTVEHIMLAIH